MMKYEAVIFDLDGTLLDTLEDLKDSVNQTLEAYGFPVKSMEEIRSFVGNGVERLMELSIPNGKADPQYDTALEDFRENYLQNLQKKTKPYDGILPLLDELHKQGVKLAIVSNKFQSAVTDLKEVFFQKWVETEVGESSEIKKKPAPDMLWKAMENLGLSTITDLDKCVFIGDSEVDLEIAKNAGIPCISVSWGFRSREYLLEQGAVTLADNIGELRTYLGL